MLCSYTPEFEVIVYRPDGRAFTKADLPYLVLLQVGHPAGDGTPRACSLFDGELINVTVQNGNLVVGLKGPPEKNNRVRHFSEQYGFREFVPILVERTVVAHVKLETAAVVQRGLVGSGLAVQIPDYRRCGGRLSPASQLLSKAGVFCGLCGRVAPD